MKDNDPSKFVIRQGGCQFAETTEDAIILTLLAEALMILIKPCEIRIFTKARGVFSTLESRRYEDWKCSKWRKSDQNIAKNAHLWDIITHALETHTWKVTDQKHSYQEYMKTEMKKWQ